MGDLQQLNVRTASGWGNLGSISAVRTLSGLFPKILLSLTFPKALNIKGSVALAPGKLTQGQGAKRAFSTFFTF